MADYHSLSDSIKEKINEDRKNHKENPYAFKDENVLRRNMEHDRPNLWRPVFVRDVEKILHVPYYNRYSDKTQVFSFYKNDDISRRALHVQLVARIARNLADVLNLNSGLAEAIALGHDIGHTPFGHAGERILNEIYFGRTGKRFNHNVQSVRVLDKIIKRNISLQTLDGILCHNGELEQKEYRPVALYSFEEFDKKVEECYIDENAVKHLVPCTFEGCVVRISDIIAYLGKDRQDAERLGILPKQAPFFKGKMGNTNPEIINNLIVNIIENSYGKDFLCMDDGYFSELGKAKKENYEMIYGNKELNKEYNDNIKPMFYDIYEKLLKDAKDMNKSSFLYRHHINYVNENNRYNRYGGPNYEEMTDPDQLVVDFIASMTDDYFVDIYKELFPEGKYKVKYMGYFSEHIVDI